MQLLDLLALFTSLLLVRVCNGQTQYTNNSYEHVLVVIDETIKRDDSLITKIQEFMQITSNAMYVATKGHVYMKSVDILIPNSWHGKYNISTNQSIDVADWLVAPENPVYGSRPYVSQSGGCGESGQFAHVTPEFLLQTPVNPAAGKLLLTMWSKHRYGVFDESAPYPQTDMEIFTNEFKPFYPDQDEATHQWQLYPTVCGSITGDVHTTSNEACKKFNGMYELKCRFYPDAHQSVNSSIMYTNELEDIVGFCDDHGPSQHNAKALNEQNKKCDQKSVWSVLRSHPDFRDFKSKPALQDAKIPPPTIFNLLQPYTTPRIVFVLDVSGSMSGCRISNLHTIVSQVISNIQLPVELGMVRFSTFANILLNLTYFNTTEDIQKVLALIPTQIDDATCLQCGLDATIKALTSSSSPTEGTNFVLISDGDENVGSAYTSVNEILNSGVVVNSVSMGQSSAVLTMLAKITGGKTYTVHDGCVNAATLMSAIVNAVRTPKDVVVTSSDVKMPVQEGASSSGSFVIDSTLGTNTRINLLYDPTDGHMETTFVDPAGVTYAIGHDGFWEDKASGTVRLSLDKALPGEWHYVVTRTSVQYSQRHSWSAAPKLHIQIPVPRTRASEPESVGLISVMSQPVSEQQPLLLTVWPSAEELDIQQNTRMTIYTFLRRSTTPVLNAQVQAKVTNSHNAVITVDLYDNGAGADTTASDGVYSGSFANFVNDEGVQRYSVEVVATDGVDTVYADADGKQTNPTGAFSRSGITSFLVTNAVDTNSKVPPGLIKDLVVRDVNTATRAVKLAWSAPGGQYDSGRAKSYELAYSDNLDDVVPNVLEHAKRLNLSTMGVVPMDFLTAQQVVLSSLPAANAKTTWVFRMRAVNEYGVYSTWSPYVTTSFVTPEPPQPTTTQGPAKPTTTTPRPTPTTSRPTTATGTHPTTPTSSKTKDSYTLPISATVFYIIEAVAALVLILVSSLVTLLCSRTCCGSGKGYSNRSY